MAVADTSGKGQGPAWRRYIDDDSQLFYYYNHSSAASVWERPEEYNSAEDEAAALVEEEEEDQFDYVDEEQPRNLKGCGKGKCCTPWKVFPSFFPSSSSMGLASSSYASSTFARLAQHTAACTPPSPYPLPSCPLPQHGLDPRVGRRLKPLLLLQHHH